METTTSEGARSSGVACLTVAVAAAEVYATRSATAYTIDLTSFSDNSMTPRTLCKT